MVELKSWIQCWTLQTTLLFEWFWRFETKIFSYQLCKNDWGKK